MRMSIVEFRNQLAEPINKVAYQGERVILERRGKGIAALVSMDDLRSLEAMEDAADLKAAITARKEKGAIPLEQIKREFERRDRRPPSGESKLWLIASSSNHRQESRYPNYLGMCGLG